MFKSRVVKNDGNVAVNEVFCTLCNEIVETRTSKRPDKAYCPVMLWLEIAPVGQVSSVLLAPIKIAAHDTRCPAKKR
jgi:hypothetical protein